MSAPDPRGCPRCAAAGGSPRDQCVRCFTRYCRACPATDGGRLCPTCGMSQRIVLPAAPAAGPA